MEYNSEKFNSNQLGRFDKKHSDYRFMQFQKFMTLRMKEFINNFSFDGDEDFTRAKQRIFLKMCFEYGYSGVLNTEAIIKDKISDEQLELIDALDVPLQQMVKDAMGTHIPLAIFPTHWDETERVISGTGITAPRHNLNKKTYTIDKTNTAILQFDSNHMSGFWWWLIPAYISSSTDLVIKKRLSLLDAKLVNNKVNNTHRNIAYSDVYDMEKDFIELAPAQTSMTGGKSEDIDISKMLDAKLKKLDLSNGETINDLLAFMEAHEKKFFNEQGKRTNTNDGKQERSISMDFQSMEVHWRNLEQEFKDQFQMFIEDYKVLFGKELTLKCLTDETIKSMEEQEVKKAGHNDAPAKPNEKGAKYE